MAPAEFKSWLREAPRRCLVMGVLNVTPDSFSDGGRFFDPPAAAEHALAMTGAGADVIDIGGESTRPGSGRISAQEQIRRVVPVLKTLAGRIGAVLSIDTTRSEVAQAALDHGATLVNDISAGLDDAGMFPLVARTGCPIILMHMLGQPATMQQAPHYDDVTADILRHLQSRMAAAEAAGIPTEHLLVDPGIGFGKTVEHNLQLLRELRRFAVLGRPVVVGASRKSFLARVTGEGEPGGRLMGTAATVAWAVANHAGMVRVHDVEAMVKVVRTIRAIMGNQDNGNA
jgi:dihydropteroate synthase